MARRPNHESRTETTSGSEFPFTLKITAIQPTHPKLSQNMYSLSSQALRRRAPCSGPATASRKYIDICQCTALQRATTAVVAQQQAQYELVQELELLQHYGANELNLVHLHSYPSQGGCHRECCKSRFRQYEPFNVSKRTHAWPWASTNEVRSSDGLECAAAPARGI